MPLKLRNLFCAITILVGVLATKPCAQSLGRDDDRIWIEFDMQIRPQPGHPTGNTYRGGKLSLRVTGLLEPMEYDTPEAIDNPDIIGFCCPETPWTMSAEPCQEVEPDGRVSSLPMGQINHQAKMDVTMKCDLSTGLCELRLFSREITTELGLVDFDYTFGCLYEAERQETSCQPRVSITRDDLEGDFEKSYTWEDIGGGLFVTGCASIPTYRLVLRARPPDETKVTLAGCADIMMGVAAEITATAKPEGGTYTWSVEPADIFSISGSGSTATVTGKSAGRATIRVEYQPKKGKKVEATLPGSVVELVSVDNIPQIGLYDETGAAKPAVQIRTMQDPPDVALMSFPVADPGVAKVENLGTGLLIQGVNEGTTTARGKTRCGDQDEQTITIEVVPCDKATIQKLRDQMKELEVQLEEVQGQIKSTLNDPELQRVLREKDRHLTKMAVKALGIFSSAAGEGDLGDVADMLGEIHDITEEGTWEGRWSAKDMLIKSYVNLGKKLTIGILDDLVEYGEAGLEVGHGMDVMKASTEALKESYKRRREISNRWQEIHHRRSAICDDQEDDESEPGKPQPPEPPPTEPQPPTPQPTEPQPSEPKPPTPQPTEPQPVEPVEPEPIEPPGESEPPVPDDDDIIGDPPLPPITPPGGSGGFQVECGCDGWDRSGWGDSPEGMSRIGQDIGSMVPCLEDFNRNTVRSMEIVNDSTSQLFDLMEQALTLSETQKVQAFREFLPLMSDLKVKYTQFGSEFKGMSDSLSRCSPKFERAVEIIGTAGQETEQ